MAVRGEGYIPIDPKNLGNPIQGMEGKNFLEALFSNWFGEKSESTETSTKIPSGKTGTKEITGNEFSATTSSESSTTVETGRDINDIPPAEIAAAATAMREYINFTQDTYGSIGSAEDA